MFGMLLACVLLAADDNRSPLDVLPATINGVDADQMLHAYLMDLADKAFAARRAKYEAIETPEQISQYQEDLYRFFVDALGGFPERSPLNAQVVGQAERDGYRIEKILFESQPKHFVTGILYLPDAQPPYPAVLVPCGHSSTGKARDLYQRAYRACQTWTGCLLLRSTRPGRAASVAGRRRQAGDYQFDPRAHAGWRRGDTRGP